MTIHREHPFSDPPEVRDPGRQLRGRLAVGVTLWTSGSLPDRAAGLTVSSVLVAPGARSGCWRCSIRCRTCPRR